jgi:diguanylate cyclase (GGDEF)-like protein
MLASTTGMQAPNILVVDDDDVDRERLIRLLKRDARHTFIAEATSKASALEALKVGGFDFVFLDFQLDDGDGRDIVADIHRANHACLIVAVTGSGNERIAAEAIKSGIYEYLPKFELTALRVKQTIDDGLRLAQIQKQLREAEQLLQRRSLYDTLTDLPNRNLFFDRLEQCCASYERNHTPFAVLMIDLDRFKEVNDTLGHQAGDEVLKEVGFRFSSLLRNTDTLARLGGDEFAALLIDVDSIERALPLAQKIIDTLSFPVVVNEQALSVGASVGIALCPLHATQPTALVSCADKAMYAAKQSVLSVVVHQGTNADNADAQTSHALVRSMEVAIHHDELHMYYQPKVNLCSGEVKGFEALVRWQPYEKPIRNPDSFIAAVESSNLLSVFTYKTLDLVLQQVRAWMDTEWTLPVSVNISARMLEEVHFVEHVLGQLDRHHVPAELLILELTETSLVINPLTAQKVLCDLQSHGIALSIDDFGAGFTSYRYLKTFPITEIKLDNAFVRNLQDNSFDTSLIRSLGVFCEAQAITFVAEGVETLSLAPLLVKLGCQWGQGYGISFPMPANDVRPWLLTRSASRPCTTPLQDKTSP